MTAVGACARSASSRVQSRHRRAQTLGGPAEESFRYSGGSDADDRSAVRCDHHRCERRRGCLRRDSHSGRSRRPRARCRRSALSSMKMTALFALCMAELCGVSIDDPERAGAIILVRCSARSGRARSRSWLWPRSRLARPSREPARFAGTAIAEAAPKWGNLLAQQLPDSALVSVTTVLARQAIAQGPVAVTSAKGADARTSAR